MSNFMTTYPLPHTSKKLFFHNIVVGMTLYCLLVQGVPWYQVNPIPGAVTAPLQQPNSRQTKSIKLQYTSANHVLGFGPSQVIVGSPTHALTMTLSNAKAVDPTVAHVTPGPVEPSSSVSFSEQIQPFLNTISYVHPWPKVTVLYKPKSNAIVESEYHIEAGFNKQTIKQIRIHYNRPVEIDDQGRLNIKYDLGNMQESAPIAWQIIEGQKAYVPVQYKKYDSQEIGFTVKGYDNNYNLIIDPSLTWHTFLGGTGSDNGYAIAVDGSGNVYVGGSSSATWGTPVQAFSGTTDAFVAKLNSSGVLQWNTFLGSPGIDQGYGIAVDGSGNVYVGGNSTGTWGTPVRAFGSPNDAFAAKLNSSGVLQWNTFIGGGGDDYGYGLAMDGSNVYVGGYSSSNWGTPVRAFSGTFDAFAVKLNNSGVLQWNTFLGGGGIDYGYAVNVDGSSNVYVAGQSNATWSTPVRAFTNAQDAFAAKLNSSGVLQWTTFLGGLLIDDGQAIAADGSGNVYVGGTSNFAWGTPVRGFSSGDDIFAVKLDSSGILQWNTFLGGAGNDIGKAVIVAGSGNVYLGGSSNATWGVPFRAYSSSEDGLGAKLDNSGVLQWNTFLGGAGIDDGNAVAVDGSGNVYLGGSSDATWGSPISPFGGGANDAWAVKIADDAPGTPTNTPTSTETPTISPTYTVTPTISPSPTFTSTVTPSSTSTGTVSPSPTFTSTATPTSTSTGTVSPTVTPSPVFTYTPTPSSTSTSTITPSVTPTPILSSTPTMTVTPTFSPSPTQTISSQASLLSNLIIYPNPFRTPSQQVTIQYTLSKDADVTITFYSYLGVKVKSIQMRAGENGGRGNSTGLTNQITWDGRNSNGLLQSTGGYICQVVARSKATGKQEKITSKIGLMR